MLIVGYWVLQTGTEVQQVALFYGFFSYANNMPNIEVVGRILSSVFLEISQALANARSVLLNLKLIGLFCLLTCIFCPPAVYCSFCQRNSKRGARI